MHFEFTTAHRIIFGNGVISQLGQLVADYGSRAVIVSGISDQPTLTMTEILHQDSIETLVIRVNEEPTVESVQQAVHKAKLFKTDMVIGFGGGSAIDTAKAIGGLMTNQGEVIDYLEVVGKGLPLTLPSKPVIAIPTTAGTGSEVTKNAVISIPEFRVKVSLRSPHLLPRLAVIDPELTYSMSPELTASTGMDALTQLIEPFLCNTPNPITDGICREGINRIARALLRAFQNGHHTEAREDMCIASLLGGMALANARLGAVHGFAGVIGGMFHIPHGAICARLLPIVVEINLRALDTRQQRSLFHERYREIACLLTNNPKAVAIDCVRWIQELSVKLRVQPLKLYGLDHSKFSDIIKKASHSSSMRGNPITLTNDEMYEILDRAL